MFIIIALVAVTTFAVSSGEKPLPRTLSEQIAVLKSQGYDPARLDGNMQLRVFLYTWLAMERGEGGYVSPIIRIEII